MKLKKVIQVRVKEETHKALCVIGSCKQETESNLVRQAITEFIDRHRRHKAAYAEAIK